MFFKIVWSCDANHHLTNVIIHNNTNYKNKRYVCYFFSFYSHFNENSYITNTIQNNLKNISTINVPPNIIYVKLRTIRFKKNYGPDLIPEFKYKTTILL